MATIVTKNSSTASAVPTTSDLVQGELAVNVTDKRIFTENASTQIVELGTNPSTITTATATVTGTLTANGTFASSNAVITGGTVNGVVIGGSTPLAITGTTVTASTGFVGGLTGNVTGNLTGNVTGNVTGNLTGNVTGNVTASTGTTTLNNLVVNGTADFTNTKLVNVTTPVAGTDAANKSYVDDTVAAVIDSAPAALDTLNELAAALGDDANFSTTITNSIATKLPLAGGTMTGAIAMGTSKITGLGNPTAAQDAATKTYVDTADALKLNLTGGTMSGAIAMGTNKITGVGDPTLAQDAATKAYTDSILGSATSAADSAAAAATSASNAATSASDAATSATASANSATASANSATAAAASYDAFDDRYLGDKASDPALDNDGNALLTGALYFNTTSDVMRVYNGTAWQDTATNPNSPTFNGTVTSDGYTLEEIALSKADTAVDVFVYDTRKDSDGGAWRKRTQHTSWYNETLNTATRGSRREFPAVAVIVAESNQVTIYDGDDPDLPMWMVFNTDAANNFLLANIGSTTAVNAKIGFGNPSVYPRLQLLDFIAEENYWITGQSVNVKLQGIASRNEATNTVASSKYGVIVDSDVNDVAMTVLPNAPIDAATGLPVPTIAVATDGGVSVINNDGTVADSASGSAKSAVAFDGITLTLVNDSNGATWVTDSYSSDGFAATVTYNVSGTAEAQIEFASTTALVKEVLGATQGLTLLDTAETQSASMHSNVTSTYNTGWMNGDIKLATLSDTDDTDVTGSELVTNGDFSSTDLSDWSEIEIGSGTATFTVTSGALHINLGGSYDTGVGQSFTTVVGKTYTLSFDLVFVTNFNSNNNVQYSAGTAINIINNGASNALSDGTYSLTFTATATTTWVNLRSAGSTNTTGEYSLDNISVRIAEADRSVNDNGLQVFGTITKNPVATGADLVAYSGFSASNYLEQPYNSDLDFGTGDFCVMGWVKSAKPTVGDATIISRQQPDYTGQNFKIFASNTTGYLSFNSEGLENETSVDICNGEARFFAVLRVSGQIFLYVDGKLALTEANTTDLTNNAAALGVGVNVSDPTSGAWPGSIALLRISATAPTAEQIAKIYEDEKFLFQENSQATLYGSSDSVTALAYDDDTELLHVGTSAGRSVFQGLRRVDNTTDAVGAAISASNGLIAED